MAAAAPAAAERARTPADATVFIRVSVSVRTEVVDTTSGMRRRVETEMFRVNGSGFVMSAFGHVLTNHHVISPDLEEFILEQTGHKASGGTLSVGRIGVCFPRQSAVWSDLVAQPGPDEVKCLDAFVMAQDADLDLAVLSVSAPNLPYLAMGDSDAVEVGQTETALGFPLGARLEIGDRPATRDAVPALTQMPGIISALRMGCGTGPRRGPCDTAADRERERRFFQISNSLNSGNSGGPLVSRDGFVIGLVQSKVKEAYGTPVEGIGFAIPINVVKDFLEDRGLDTVLPVRRLRAGQVHSLEAKRLRLSLPEGMADTAAPITHVETDAQQVGPPLRIDRVLSPWSTERMEEELLGTATFERVTWTAHESRVMQGRGRVSRRVGRGSGESPAMNDDAWMYYAIVDLGAEKLVARYVGTAEELAFNENVLTQSILSLDGQLFPIPDPGSLGRLTWSRGLAGAQPSLPTPSGWTIGSGGPAPCAGLPSPATAGTASASLDFSVTLRAAEWAGFDVAAADAARACAQTRGSQPGASYMTRFEWLGVTYLSDGVFIAPAPGRVIRLEVLAPEARAAYALALLAEWVRQVEP